MSNVATLWSRPETYILISNGLLMLIFLIVSLINYSFLVSGHMCFTLFRSGNCPITSYAFIQTASLPPTPCCLHGSGRRWWKPAEKEDGRRWGTIKRVLVKKNILETAAHSNGGNKKRLTWKKNKHKEERLPRTARWINNVLLFTLEHGSAGVVRFQTVV